MAATQYIGVAGAARKVKEQYIGVAGAARKVKTGYIGVGGVARKCYDAGLDIKPTLADNDWATISAVSELGIASTYWSVGDEKDITLSTGEVLTMVIVDFSHDRLYDGRKKCITFGMKHLMEAPRAMNSTDHTNGGFKGSDMYTWLNTTVYSALPSDLKSVIRAALKYTSAGNKSTTINSEYMNLWLFSLVEVIGAPGYSVEGEGSQYPYFATKDNRIKKLANGSGEVSIWHVRSPRAASEYGFCAIGRDGIMNNGSATTKYGVCFGFCV